MLSNYYYDDPKYNFSDFGACVVAAVQQANKDGTHVSVYRLITYSDGGQEAVKLAVIYPGIA